MPSSTSSPTTVSVREYGDEKVLRIYDTGENKANAHGLPTGQTHNRLNCNQDAVWWALSLPITSSGAAYRRVSAHYRSLLVEMTASRVQCGEQWQGAKPRSPRPAVSCPLVRLGRPLPVRKSMRTKTGNRTAKSLGRGGPLLPNQPDRRSPILRGGEQSQVYHVTSGHWRVSEQPSGLRYVVAPGFDVLPKLARLVESHLLLWSRD